MLYGPLNPGETMAKRASTVKTVTKPKVQSQEVNPGVNAAGTWDVYRSGQKTLSINADQLEITDSGALIFIVAGANSTPPVVVAANQYLYCARVR
jgi:hypothetical protein